MRASSGAVNRNRACVVIPLAFVLTLALLGCGSSSSGLSKQQLASKTNAICSKYSAKIKAVPAPSDILQNHASAAKYFDQIAPLYDQAVGELSALKPADSVKAQWGDLVAKFSAIRRLLDEIKVKADSADPSGLALLTQVNPLTSAANTAATGLGASTCANT